MVKPFRDIQFWKALSPNSQVAVRAYLVDYLRWLDEGGKGEIMSLT